MAKQAEQVGLPNENQVINERNEKTPHTHTHTAVDAIPMRSAFYLGGIHQNHFKTWHRIGENGDKCEYHTKSSQHYEKKQMKCELRHLSLALGSTDSAYTIHCHSATRQRNRQWNECFNCSRNTALGKATSSTIDTSSTSVIRNSKSLSMSIPHSSQQNGWALSVWEYVRQTTT